MNRKGIKRVLRSSARPIKIDLFKEVGFTEEELKLMKYLYIDKINNQFWIADELGISLPTLTNWHNNCIDQVLSFFNYQLYKFEHHEENCFSKYFT